MEIEKYMNEALKEAKKAYQEGEVPVGCVIVHENKIIARGHNQREKTNNPTAHAEIIAIRKATKKRQSWRLEDCDIYVTIEPCAMCAGALMWSRIRTIYYGAKDPKGGAVHSSFSLYDQPGIHHHPTIVAGILEKEAAELMKKFFQERRK